MNEIPEIDRWAFIVNPTAGNYSCRRKWPEIRTALNHSNLNYSCYFSEKKGHVSQITLDLLNKGLKRFVAVGGDGTLNEVADGILRFPEDDKKAFILGQIAVGSGNDWRRTYSIKDNIYEAIRRIEACNTVLQDAGKALFINEQGKEETRYFLNVAGLGFDAFVTERAKKSGKISRGGKMIYMYSLLKSLFASKSVECRFEVDGISHEGEIFNVSLGIGKYNGGGMKFLPDAIPDDGLFDLTIVASISKLDVIRNLLRIYKGTFVSHPAVSQFRCANFSISSVKNYGLELDGEFTGFVPAKFEILEKCVRMVV